MTGDVQARLEGLLAAWQEAREAGRDLPAGELCRDCPELRPELEKRLEALRRMHALVEPALAGAADTATGCNTGELPSGADGSVPELVGGYRILGLLGEGGMGRVLLAQDPR